MGETRKSPTAFDAAATLTGGSRLRAKTRQYEQYGRLLAEKGGRPPNFDEETASGLKSKLENWAIEQRESTGNLPYQKEALHFVRKLVERQEVGSSDSIIIEQIVRPTFQKLKPIKPHRKK
jgi:hypothetical protein